MSNSVSQPYQVTEDDIERSSTLDCTDLDEWYILINGSMQFVETSQAGRDLRDLLTKLN